MDAGLRWVAEEVSLTRSMLEWLLGFVLKGAGVVAPDSAIRMPRNQQRLLQVRFEATAGSAVLEVSWVSSLRAIILYGIVHGTPVLQCHLHFCRTGIGCVE